MSDTQDPDDQPRSRQTAVALVLILALGLAGWWLMSAIQHHNEVQNCLASGRRDCVPLETGK
jgi:hypothetical protein